MKIDDLIHNEYLKSAIHRNKDELKINDIEDFIYFIKENISEEMYNNIYIHELFCREDKKFKCRYENICDKFKIIMFNDSCIILENIELDLNDDLDYYEKMENRIKLYFKGISFRYNETIISYEDIKNMKLEKISDYSDDEVDGYKLIIHKKEGNDIVLNTYKILNTIKEDMNKFLIDLEESFNKHSKTVKGSN